MKISELRTWAEVKASMVEGMTPVQRARWAKSLRLAGIRYHSEIRKYRGIPRLREMYRRRSR